MAFYWSRATSSGVYIRRFLVPLRWWSSSAFSWTWWQWPTLPPCRKSPITTTGVMLLQGDPSFHDWAFFLGLAVASDLEVLLAPFLYNSLEFVGNDFIKVFTCFLYFGCSCKCLVAWWLPWLPHHQSLPSGPGLHTSPGALVKLGSTAILRQAVLSAPRPFGWGCRFSPSVMETEYATSLWATYHCLRVTLCQLESWSFLIILRLLLDF